MVVIHSFLVLTAICVVAADSDQEKGADAHVSLSEFDLDDQCYVTAESEWTFLTKADLPDAVLQSKIKEEQKYGDIFRSVAEEVAPYREQHLSDTKLNEKLRIFSTAGDMLINKKQFDKVVVFSNSLQQISREHLTCTKTPCQLNLQDIQRILATSLDHEKLLHTWTEYQRRFSSKIQEYSEILQLVKVAAEANGAEDVETYWEQQSEFLGGYTKALFLWKSIEPLYQKLYAFVSKQLSRHYAFLNSTNNTLIAVHLLGTVRGNDWSSIASHILHSRTYQHLLASMTKKIPGGITVYKAAENMTAKLGLESLSPEFWTLSWFNSSCPANVVNYCENGKPRVLTCNLTGWPEYLNAYETVMRIKHIQLAEEENSFILRDNSHSSAIYEAVTGLSALLATSPRYLQQLGLLASKPSQQGLSKYSKASLLLLVALHTLPKLPYYLAADQWRLEVLSSNMTNITELSNSWRRYRRDMQMISVPSEDETIFDFLSDPYITSNKPYLGKFFGIIVQFQLLERVLEGADMDSSEFDMNDIFASNGDLKKLLRSGKTKNWPDILKEVMGINDLDSGPLLQYFRKLESYLRKLEKLEPIKTSRHIVSSTSTPPISTVLVLTRSSNDTNLLVNSTVSSVEQNSVSNEPETKDGTVTIVIFVFAGLLAVVIVVGIFVIKHRHYCRSYLYSQTNTQET